ncbi:hypothetical protein XA3_01770 [Xylocopilactobacillus apicola]|uniref:Bacteriocin n=1 Tax=Xylocopilactobacillus apicola TaxID=2932184 RepID=A0AAU9DHG7_9LACO|nr:hypothetical protein XA3_01770 [Xylocopilactobacillus apicola]
MKNFIDLKKTELDKVNGGLVSPERHNRPKLFPPYVPPVKTIKIVMH